MSVRYIWWVNFTMECQMYQNLTMVSKLGIFKWYQNLTLIEIFWWNAKLLIFKKIHSMKISRLNFIKLKV